MRESTQTDDPDATNNHQTTFTLGNNENKLDQDFGYRGNGTIGDLVFFDYVGDGGVFNATENDRGLAGVDVTLQIDVNGDTTIDFTRTVTTDGSGQYLFDNLIAGDYTITVDSTDLIDQLASNPTFDIDGVGTRTYQRHHTGRERGQPHARLRIPRNTRLCDHQE